MICDKERRNLCATALRAKVKSHRAIDCKRKRFMTERRFLYRIRRQISTVQCRVETDINLHARSRIINNISDEKKERPRLIMAQRREILNRVGRTFIIVDDTNIASPYSV